MKEDIKVKILSSDQTVFTTKEIALLLGETNGDSLKSRLNYYVKKGLLDSVRKGVYVKSEYNPLELATKIYTPSYVSLETVLEKEGVVFQHYETIFVVSYLSREIEVDGYKIRLRRIKEEILLNQKGVKNKGGYAVASKERAFLDMLYLFKDYHFDNIDVLDKKRLRELVGIYNSQALERRLEEYA